MISLEEKVAIQDTALDVIKTYYNILKAKILRELAAQSVEQLTAHKNTAQNFNDAGLIPRNDLLRAEVELANGRQRLVNEDNGFQIANAGFNMILHSDINTIIDVHDMMTYVPPSVPI